MPSGYAFGSGGYGGRARPVSSPQISPLGVVDTSRGEGAPAGPGEGMNATGSGTAQGPMGRATLAADLNSTYGSVAGKALSVMGQLGGPIAGLGMTALKAAMTADNFATLAAQLENHEIADVLSAVPTFSPQAQHFGTVDARGLAQALGVSFGGATGFSSTGVGFGGPGQSPDLTGPTAQGQNLSSTPALSSLAAALGFGTGRADQPDAPSAGAPSAAGPSAGTATGDSSTGGDPGGSTYAKGGYVKDRVPGRGDNEPALLAGGEFVIRREVVARHRKLLEHINAKAK